MKQMPNASLKQIRMDVPGVETSAPGNPPEVGSRVGKALGLNDALANRQRGGSQQVLGPF